MDGSGRSLGFGGAGAGALGELWGRWCGLVSSGAGFGVVVIGAVQL